MRKKPFIILTACMALILLLMTYIHAGNPFTATKCENGTVTECNTDKAKQLIPNAKGLIWETFTRQLISTE
jgi:hypothetical protein